MQKIGYSTSSSNEAGEFTAGNPQAGVEPTQIMVPWLNSVQRELIAVVEGGGLALDSARDDQVRTALQIMLRQGSSSYALDSGIANAYVASFTPPIAAFIDGMVVKVKVKTANNGPCTFNGKAIVGGSHGALQGGEIVADGDVWLQYNSSIGGGSWVLIASTGGSLSVAPGTKSQHAVTLSQLQNHGSQLFTATGVFNVPLGITKALVTLSGGGGGGAAYLDTSSAGGGGGGAASGIKIAVAVTPGAAVTVTVGAGGLGGMTTGAPGSAGGASSFGALVSAAGGGGGVAAGDGGAGGAATSGTVAGSYGQAYNPSATSSEQGGMGGGSAFGVGGFGSMRLGAVPARPGGGYGGGGGGGCRNIGAPGAAGFVLVEWSL